MSKHPHKKICPCKRHTKKMIRKLFNYLIYLQNGRDSRGQNYFPSEAVLLDVIIQVRLGKCPVAFSHSWSKPLLDGVYQRHVVGIPKAITPGAFGYHTLSSLTQLIFARLAVFFITFRHKAKQYLDEDKKFFTFIVSPQSVTRQRQLQLSLDYWFTNR